MARHEELPIPVFSSLEPVYGDSSQLEEAQLQFDRLKARFQQVFGHAPDLFARSPDHRMIKEIAELAMLKHARIELMEVLKQEKNIKAASLGSIGNAHAPLFTVLFIFVMVIQGLLSEDATLALLSVPKSEGHPDSAGSLGKGVISSQPHPSQSARHVNGPSYSTPT